MPIKNTTRVNLKKEFFKEYTIDFFAWGIIVLLDFVVCITSGELFILLLCLIVPLIFQVVNILIFKSRSNRLISYLQYISIFIPSFLYYIISFLWAGFNLITYDILWSVLIVISIVPIIAVIMKDIKIYIPRKNKKMEV